MPRPATKDQLVLEIEKEHKAPEEFRSTLTSMRKGSKTKQREGKEKDVKREQS